MWYSLRKTVVLCHWATHMVIGCFTWRVVFFDPDNIQMWEGTRTLGLYWITKISIFIIGLIKLIQINIYKIIKLKSTNITKIKWFPEQKPICVAMLASFSLFFIKSYVGEWKSMKMGGMISANQMSVFSTRVQNMSNARKLPCFLRTCRKSPETALSWLSTKCFIL